MTLRAHLLSQPDPVGTAHASAAHKRTYIVSSRDLKVGSRGVSLHASHTARSTTCPRTCCPSAAGSSTPSSNAYN
jgi:hypothetical protein